MMLPPWHWLKVSLLVYFQKSSRLIFHRQPSYPKKCAEHCRTQTFTETHWEFSYTFRTTLVNIWAFYYLFIFEVKQISYSIIQHLVNLVAFTFYFYFNSIIIDSKIKSLFLKFVLVLTSLIYILITAGGMYQFPPPKFSTNRILRNSLKSEGSTVLSQQ